MTLTAKQEAFAQAIADGMTQADAYRHAYDVGVDTKPETIWSKASELMADGKVSGRVRELKEQLSAKQLWTREKSIEALEFALDLAKSNGKPTEVTSVIKELNAMHGFNAPSKIAFTDTDGKDLKPPVFNNAFVTNDTDSE